MTETASTEQADQAPARRGLLAYLELERRDLYIAGALLAAAFVLRFFSPLMPDFLAHPQTGGLINNCVQSTPVDAQGDLGTLCGLSYPFQRGYKTTTGQLAPPEGEIFDEIYFGVFAHDDLKGISYFDPEPPLSKEFIAAGEWLWGWYKATFLGYHGSYADLGFDTFGWRIAACVFGSFCPPMMFLLGRKLLPADPFFALAAGVLTCFDGMFFVQSRIGMIDIFPIFLILLTYFVFLVHWRSRGHRDSLLTLFLLGVCAGLAVSAKWISLAALGTIGFFLLARWVRAHVDLTVGTWEWGKGEGPSIPGGVSFGTYLPAAIVALLVLPAAIYVASWFPFFLRGQFHGLGDLWKYQVDSYVYHATLTAGHPYGSKWYSWPFLYRPVAYYFENQSLGFDQVTHEPLVAWMVNLGNPWIWWSSLPSLVFVAWVTFKERSFAAALITMGFVAQYLPWSRITRVVFLYHMFGGLIFMVLAVAFALNRLSKTGGIVVGLGEGSAFAITGRHLAYAHLVIAVLLFGYFYPLWTALPMSGHALLSGFPAGKAWLPTWI
ncbi:MAG TPA: phospholipid carrier-dependent glycosyltransferase [Candidatus Dormibacteraeota bacterium]